MHNSFFFMHNSFNSKVNPAEKTEFQWPYQWKKPVREDHIFPFILNIQDRQIYRDKNQISDCLGPGGWRKGWGTTSHCWWVRGFFSRWWKYSQLRLGWRLHNSVNITQITESYILNRWNVWHVNSISIKLFQKYPRRGGFPELPDTWAGKHSPAERAQTCGDSLPSSFFCQC